MRVLIVAASLFVALSSASPALAAKVSLAGQVTYRERIALPNLATLDIRLVDQTVPNAPPRLAVAAPIGQGGVPLSFNLNFDDSIIVPGHSYALIATISAEGGLMFRNFEPYRLDPLAPAEAVVIVTNLVRETDPTATTSTEPTTPAPPAILDVTWSASGIAGTDILPRQRPTLLISDDMRAGGTGGCNSWFAQASIDADTIHIGSVGSTRKACSEPINQQEQAYFAALAAAVTWKVEADQLTLFGKDGEPLLVFTR